MDDLLTAPCDVLQAPKQVMGWFAVLVYLGFVVWVFFFLVNGTVF